MTWFCGLRQRGQDYVHEGTLKYTNGANSRRPKLQEEVVENFSSGKLPRDSLKLLEVDEELQSTVQKFYSRQQSSRQNEKEIPGELDDIVKRWGEEIGKLAKVTRTKTAHSLGQNKTKMDVEEHKLDAEENLAVILDVILPTGFEANDLVIYFPRKTMKSDTKGNRWEEPLHTRIAMDIEEHKSKIYQPIKEIEDTAPLEKMMPSNLGKVPLKVVARGNEVTERMNIHEDSMEDRLNSSTIVHQTAYDDGQFQSLKTESDPEITSVSVTSVGAESQFARQSCSANIVPEIAEEDHQNGLKMVSDPEITSVSVTSVGTERQFAHQSGSANIVPEITEEDHQNDLKMESDPEIKSVSVTSVGTESQFACRSRSANIIIVPEIIEEDHLNSLKMESDPEITSVSVTSVGMESQFARQSLSDIIFPEITEEDNQNGHSHTTKSARITCRTCSTNIVPTSPMKQYSSENVGAMRTSTSHQHKLKDWLRNGMPRARDIDGFLLYCLLYAYDERVSTSKLVSYCMQDGLITGNAVDNRRGEEIVELLTNAGLLERNDGDLLVNMPDTSKDSALEILLSEVDAIDLFLGTDSGTPSKLESCSYPFGQYLAQTGAGSNNPITKKAWENGNIIFLMNNELLSLPESPNCSNLFMLFLQRNHHLRAIPGSFFSWMHSLRIFDVSETNITSLSPSISHLVSLVRLIARNCKRLTRLPPEVRELKRIESIEAGGSNIYKLPKQIGELPSMKCLELSLFGPVDPREYSMLPKKLISPGIMSKLTSLTTLSICVHPGDRRWIKDINSTIADISLLKNLTSLRLHFPKIENLTAFLTENPSWRSIRTTKFNFVVGHDVKRIICRVPHYMEQEFNQKCCCLRYVNGETVPEGVIEVLKSSKAFYLDHHVEIRSLSEFGAKNFNMLKLCIISECPEMETIVDGSDEPIFAELELLSINYLPSCKSIWRGSLSNGSFAKLKCLQVQACLKLNNLLTTSMCRYIVNLEKLVVKNCAVMEEIISDGNSEKLGDSLLPSLKILELGHLPNLVRILQGPWPRVERLSFYHLPKLKNLNFGSNFELKKSVKMIEAEPIWWNNLEWDNDYVYREIKESFKPRPEDDHSI